MKTDYELYVEFYTRVNEPVVVFDEVNQVLCYGKIVDFDRRVSDKSIIFVDLEIETINGAIITVNTGFNVNYTLLRIVRLTNKYLMSNIKNMSFETLLKEGIMPEDTYHRLFLGDAQNWDPNQATKCGVTIQNVKVGDVVSPKSFTCKLLCDDHTWKNISTKYNLVNGVSHTKHYNFYIDMILFRKLNCYDIDWLHEIEKYVILDKNLKYTFSTITPDIHRAAKKMRAQMEFVQSWLNSREFLLDEKRFDIQILEAIDE